MGVAVDGAEGAGCEQEEDLLPVARVALPVLRWDAAGEEIDAEEVATDEGARAWRREAIHRGGVQDRDMSVAIDVGRRAEPAGVRGEHELVEFRGDRAVVRRGEAARGCRNI